MKWVVINAGLSTAKILDNVSQRLYDESHLQSVMGLVQIKEGQILDGNANIKVGKVLYDLSETIGEISGDLALFCIGRSRKET